MDIYQAMDTVAASGMLAGRPTLAEARQIRAQLWRTLQGDPLVRQYVQRSGPEGRGAALSEPWMAMAEQRLAAALMAGPASVAVLGGEILPGLQEDQWRAGLAVQLRTAQPYLWGADVFALVRSCPLPPHVIARELLPFPFTYHTTDVAYTASAPPPETWRPGLEARYAQITTVADALESDWTLVADIPGHHKAQTYMQLTGVPRRPEHPNFWVLPGELPYGQRWPEDVAPDARQPVGLLLGLFAFLHSPYVEVTAQRLPRAWRRHDPQLRQAGAHEPLVHVVTLRQAAREAVAAYDAEPRAWKHRWWVAAHYRRQWYPSRQTHDVIWIAPYLKGPEGAPLLDKVYNVVR